MPDSRRGYELNNSPPSGWDSACQRTAALFLVLALCGALVSSGVKNPVHCAVPARTYEISGTHSVYGKYRGLIELSSVNRIANRVVTYDDFRFEGLKVREVWSGSYEQGGDADGPVSLNFSLKQADIFNRVDHFVRTRSQFKTPYVVAYSADFAKSPLITLSNPSGTYFEQLGRQIERTELAPLWKNERQNIPAMGDKMAAIGELSMVTLFYPIMCVLRGDRFYKSFENREEFKTRTQYCVLDPTDFEFLRANPDTVSVNNKVTDQISLLEGSLRTSAYGTPLAEKARRYGKDMREHHINQLGLFSGALFDAQDNFIDYLPNGDGALWSGMYAGSEAMRYLATKAPDALDNFKRTTSGLMLLMDVTGDEREFGRSAHLLVPGEQLAGAWARGAGKYQNLKYIKIGNNDMIKGLFHAFAWAYEILPPNDPFLAEVTEHAKRLPHLRISHEKIHPGNALLAAGLAAIASGKLDDLYKYLAVYEFVMQPVGLLRLDEGFYAGGIGDWSGVNLMMVSNVSQIIVANNVAKRFRNSAPHLVPLLDEAVGHQRQKLVETWATYRNVRRDFMTIAADAFAVSDSNLIEFPPGTKPTQWHRKDEWQTLRPLSVWGLRELPVPTSKHVLNYDYTWSPQWCLSYWPHLPWKCFVEAKPLSFYYLSAYNYPLFEGTSLDSDNVWTSAFDFRGSANPSYRNGRIDFLHVYWMGRLSGLLDEKS